MRCRPLTKTERLNGSKCVTNLLDDKVVVVLSPDDEGLDSRGRYNYGQGVQHKEKRYTFDRAFDGSANNEHIYEHTVKSLIDGVLRGMNATVFAYGATGSGKTYTMVGNERDPGLMVMSLRDIFGQMQADSDKDFHVRCSYLEVYNEIIYDLLQANSPGLDLREDPELGPQAAGLKRVEVNSADRIFQLLREGNMRGKTEATDANAVSSRSHAVLEIVVNRADRNNYQKNVFMGKLALVDLAGAERAHETNNHGQQLRDGANVNRSLLALANCINALGKRKKKGFVFVPFRNSKLTRLLKDGLCGNSRTVMIATVASSDAQYNHTVNTLKYADRAKEIKTHVRVEKKTVHSHILEYQRMIDTLNEENRQLKDGIRSLQAGMPLDAEVPVGLPMGKPQVAPAPAASETDPEDEEWVRVNSKALEMLGQQRVEGQRSLRDALAGYLQHQVALEALEDALAVQARGGARRELLESLREKLRSAATEMSGSGRQCERLRSQLAKGQEQFDALQDAVEQAADVGVHCREQLRAAVAVEGRKAESSALQMDTDARENIIQEQFQIIDALWNVMGNGGLTRDKAVDIAKENVMLDGGLVWNDLGPGTSSAFDDLDVPEELRKELQFEYILSGGRARAIYKCYIADGTAAPGAGQKAGPGRAGGGSGESAERGPSTEADPATGGAPERGSGSRKARNRSASNSSAAEEGPGAGRQRSRQGSQAVSREDRSSPEKLAPPGEAQRPGPGEPARRGLKGLNGLKRGGRSKVPGGAAGARPSPPRGGQDSGGVGTPIPLDASPQQKGLGRAQRRVSRDGDGPAAGGAWKSVENLKVQAFSSKKPPTSVSTDGLSVTGQQAGSPENARLAGGRGPLEGGADVENLQPGAAAARGGGKEAARKPSPYDLPVGKMKKISALKKHLGVRRGSFGGGLAAAAGAPPPARQAFN